MLKKRICLSLATIITFLIISIPFHTTAAGNQLQIERKQVSGKFIQKLKGVKPFSHPRLHFTSKDIPKLRKQAKTTHARQWDNLRKTVERHSDWEPLSSLTDEYLLTGSREVYLEEAGAMLTNVALAYVIDENPKYLERARRWLKKMCQVPEEKLRNYGFGFYLMGLARAYDWLYPELSEEERKTTRDHIAKTTRIMDELLFPKDGSPRSWWGDNYLHHDAWIPFAGYGVGALALLGEVDEALLWATRSRQDFDIAFSLLGDDGAWHEGPADWCYTLAALLMFFEPWERATGENVFNIPWIRNTGKYRLYAWLPDDTYIYVNDSFRSGRYNISGSASSHIVRKLASTYRDGHLQWLGNRDEEFDLKEGPKGVQQSPYSWQQISPEYPYPQIHCAAWNVLWYDTTVKPISPKNLPLDHYFENQGIAFLRSGWDEDASVTSFSCGPRGGHNFARALKQGKRLSQGNISHAQAQYNAFTIFADGEYFIIPPGYGLRDARFQNTVLINGEGLRYEGETEPIIQQFDSQEAYVYILGDATDAFYPELGVSKSYRHFIFLRPDIWIVYDNLIVRSSQRRSTRRYEWRIHTDPIYQVKTKGDEVIIGQIDAKESSVLHLKILEPPSTSRSVTAARFVLEENPIILTSGKKLLNRTIASIFNGPTEWHNFAVMVNEDSWNGSSLNANLVEGDNLRAVALHRAKEDHIVAFTTSNVTEVSYIFKATSVHSTHLISGLPPEANFDVKMSPAPEYGSHYFHIQVVPNGRYQSSRAGVLYFRFGRPSGIREFPEP